MIAYVSPEDIHRWEQEGRHDIIAHAHDLTWAGDRIVTRTGRTVNSCSYLSWKGSSFFCEIYETRPLVCRNFVPGSNELCP